MHIIKYIIKSDNKSNLTKDNKELEDDRQMTFNHILIDQTVDKINDGVILKRWQNPWLKSEIGLRRANVVYAYTKAEIAEFTKCANDIQYFAEKYCKIKREDGTVGDIKLRNYQKDILNTFESSRFTILCASRQIGKCVIPDSVVDVLVGGEYMKTTIIELYYMLVSKERKLTLTEKVKRQIYRYYHRYKKYYLLKVIQFIEKIEYRHRELDEDDIMKKMLKSISVHDVEIDTDKGFKPVTDLFITQPYKIYDITFSDGTLFRCADNHILFNEKYREVFVKDLRYGDMIIAHNGYKYVRSVRCHKTKISMMDMTVDSIDHRYYTDNILSHNTVSTAIFMLHTILFNTDKNIMIVANKGDTSIEIVDKIKNIYTLLPFFLKPGIKTWNQKSISFDNGCRIKTSARTKTPAIGFTIDLLYLDEFAHIPSNIIEPYYTAVYPTVSAVKDSKIIITSTPLGHNLFYKLLTEAELPDGDVHKNNFKALRVYWYQVPGRFVTYLRLNDYKLQDDGVDRNYIFNIVKERFGALTKVEMKYNLDKAKYIIDIYNTETVKYEDVKRLTYTNSEGMEMPIEKIAELSTWKDDAIKDIGGEDAFNQEYGLRFVNASKSLLSEYAIDDLIKNQENFVFKSIPDFDSKLKYSYDDLKWIDDENIFDENLRKEYKIIISVDIAEGLGQDSSVINIFRLKEKPHDLIEQQLPIYKKLTDFFSLVQIGIYINNLISVKRLAELLYMIVFEYFNPENCRCVVELNTYGSTLFAELPHVFNDNNDYDQYVFFRYRHNANSDEERIGLKVGQNKGLLVKDYQMYMENKAFVITNEQNVKEITNFVKNTTQAGNIRYAADSGHDDTVMTIVDATTVFDKPDFSEMVSEYLDSTMVDNDTRQFINDNYNKMLDVNNMDVIDYNDLFNNRPYRSKMFMNNLDKFNIF